MFAPAAEPNSAAAMNNLGLMLDHGWGVPLDFQETARWYRKAAESGDAFGQANLWASFILTGVA
jgi:TPR repeat protein